MAAVSKEVAIKDITEWMDVRKVKDYKRTELEASIKTVVSCIEEGSLVRESEGNKLVYELAFPIGVNEQVKTLVFKDRLSMTDRQEYMKDVKPGDTEGRYIAIAAALTGNSSALIRGLDSGDWDVVFSISLFF